MFLHGITVKLHVKHQTGTDELNNPVFETTVETVENVLVGTPTDSDIAESDSLTAGKENYVLGIPKTDNHNWEDTIVEFRGEKYRTIGKPVKGIDDLVPMEWNLRVRVESYE